MLLESTHRLIAAEAYGSVRSWFSQVPWLSHNLKSEYFFVARGRGEGDVVAVDDIAGSLPLQRNRALRLNSILLCYSRISASMEMSAFEKAKHNLHALISCVRRQRTEP